MTGGVRCGGLRLPETRRGPRGEHEPFVGHVEDLHAGARVMEKALLELEQHEVERREQLRVRKVRERVLERVERASSFVVRVRFDRRSPPAMVPVRSARFGRG